MKKIKQCSEFACINTSDRVEFIKDKCTPCANMEKSSTAHYNDSFDHYGMCFRCEHRARFLETKTWQPRAECGDVDKSKHSCYMYKPVEPVILQVQKGDKRPVGGPALIAARMETSKEQLRLRDKLQCYAIELEKGKIAYIYEWKFQKKGDE
jgi:hypothetical protein